MNRDLLFFVTGLSFGIAAGYFLFRAISPPGESPAASVAQAPPSEQSSIGLDEEPELRELDEAQMRRLEEKASQDPDDSETRAEMGRLYMEAGRHEEAVRYLEEALSLAPSNLHARAHLALSYLNQGRLEPAVAAFEENLARDPEHPPSLLGLGRIKLYVQQDIRGGLALWEKLVQIAPESAEARAVRDELEALKSAHAGS